MAYLYGVAGKNSTAQTSGSNSLLLHSGLPMFLLVFLAAAGAVTYPIHPALTAVCAALFLLVSLNLKKIRQAFTRHLEQPADNIQAQKLIAQALLDLPDEYHVFHGLSIQNQYVDHLVLGPNGLFLIVPKSQQGKITPLGEALRLDGKSFYQDMVQQCWNLTQNLSKHLELQYTGTVLSPVLCFSRAMVEILRPVRGVHVIQTDALVPLILQHDDSIPPEVILKLIDRFAALTPAGESGGVRSADSRPIFDHEADTSPAQALHGFCDTCGYQATETEQEKFPLECPKCSALYYAPAPGAAPPTPEATPPTSSADRPLFKGKSTRRPILRWIATATVLALGGGAFLTYQSGLFSSPPEQIMHPKQETLANATDQVLALESTNQTVPEPAPPVVQPAPEPAPQPTQHEAPQPVQQTEVQHEDAVKPELAVNASTTAETAPKASPETTEAPQPDQKAAPEEKKPEGKKSRQFEKGTLVVSATNPITLWLTDQQTAKRFGPYQISANTSKDIVLPKGMYTVIFLENGQRGQTSLSFLSDKGHLDF